jgi:hypothetical protein
MVSGRFSAGKEAVLKYGGVLSTGGAADKLWYFDTTQIVEGTVYSFRFENVRLQDWNQTAFREILFMNHEDGGFECDSALTLYLLSTSLESPNPETMAPRIRVQVSMDSGFVEYSERKQIEYEPGNWIRWPCLPTHVEDSDGVPVAQIWRDHWAQNAPRLLNGSEPSHAPAPLPALPHVNAAVRHLSAGAALPAAVMD